MSLYELILCCLRLNFSVSCIGICWSKFIKKRAVWSFLSSFLCGNHPFFLLFTDTGMGCLKFHITSGLDQLAEKRFCGILQFLFLCYRWSYHRFSRRATYPRCWLPGRTFLKSTWRLSLCVTYFFGRKCRGKLSFWHSTRLTFLFKVVLEKYRT